jgi:hypothetical protein
LIFLIKQKGFDVGSRIKPLVMAELIRYHVRVVASNEPSFEMREPRRLREGDRVEWHGHAYQVVTVRFSPDRPHHGVATVARTISRN